MVLFFVEREIVPGGAAYLLQNLVHAAQDNRGGQQRAHLVERGLLDDLLQHCRHFLHRQNMGGIAGGDGALRHAVIFGGSGVLHHANATSAMNGAQTQRAVAGGTREDDTDGFVPLIFGK